MNGGIRVSFVIVTWNAEDTIESCLKSIPLSADIEVMVVDNASTDKTLAVVCGVERDIKILAMGSNTGFACACNAGARKAAGEFVLFLNPDAVLWPGSLELLVESLCADSTLFAVAPVETTADGRVVGVGERFLSLRQLFAHRVLGWKRFRRVKRPSKPCRVDWISGAAFLARRDRFLELGGFDERFWMYVEDMDLCRRASRRCWGVAVVPDATLVHRHSHSAAQNLERTLKSNAVGTLLWFQSTGSRRSATIARWILLASLPPQALLCLVHGRGRKGLGVYRRVAMMLLSSRPLQAQLTSAEYDHTLAI